jgi:WD40 repeat protein
MALEDRKQQHQSKKLVDSLPVNIDFLSELKRHSSPVNAVRFSPKGDLIASAGDGKLSICIALGQDADLLARYVHHHLEIVSSERDNVWKRLHGVRKGELVRGEHVLVSTRSCHLCHGCV